jgi:hypothetical protein
MISKQYYNDIDFSLNHIDNLNFIIKKYDLNVSKNEKDTLRDYIKRQINSKGIIDACNNVGVDPTTAPMLWLKTKTESVRVTNPLFEKPEEKEFKQPIFILVNFVMNGKRAKNTIKTLRFKELWKVSKAFLTKRLDSILIKLFLLVEMTFCTLTIQKEQQQAEHHKTPTECGTKIL